MTVVLRFDRTPARPAEPAESAAPSALGPPVIDTRAALARRHDLEDYVAVYGGPPLVDELRRAARARGETGAAGSDEELRPELLCAIQAARGVDHTVILCDGLVVHFAKPDQRQRLARAVNHHQATVWSRFRRAATVAAYLPIDPPRDSIRQLEFAVLRLGFKLAGVDLAALERADQATLAPLWARAAELGVPIIAIDRARDGGTHGFELCLPDGRGPAVIARARAAPEPQLPAATLRADLLAPVYAALTAENPLLFAGSRLAEKLRAAHHPPRLPPLPLAGEVGGCLQPPGEGAATHAGGALAAPAEMKVA